MSSRKKIQIGYSDFLRLCMVDDPNDFLYGFKVRKDGVWVIPPSNDVYLTPEERAVLSEHPKKDLTIPALAFPCSIKQLYDFLKFAEAVDCIEQSELSKFKQLFVKQLISILKSMIKCEASKQLREAQKWLFKKDSDHTPSELPESVSEPDLIKRKKHPKIQGLIINAMPELDELHQVLRNKVGFSIHITDRESKFQEVALRRFNENCNEFKYVKLEYLRDETLYNLYRPGQEKGDFIGKLLQKILKDHDLGDHGAQKCYNIYKEAKSKSKTD